MRYIKFRLVAHSKTFLNSGAYFLILKVCRGWIDKFLLFGLTSYMSLPSPQPFLLIRYHNKTTTQFTYNGHGATLCKIVFWQHGMWLTSADVSLLVFPRHISYTIFAVLLEMFGSVYCEAVSVSLSHNFRRFNGWWDTIEDIFLSMVVHIQIVYRYYSGFK